MTTIVLGAMLAVALPVVLGVALAELADRAALRRRGERP